MFKQKPLDKQPGKPKQFQQQLLRLVALILSLLLTVMLESSCHTVRGAAVPCEIANSSIQAGTSTNASGDTTIIIQCYENDYSEPCDPNAAKGIQDNADIQIIFLETSAQTTHSVYQGGSLVSDKKVSLGKTSNDKDCHIVTIGGVQYSFDASAKVDLSTIKPQHSTIEGAGMYEGTITDAAANFQGHFKVHICYIYMNDGSNLFAANSYSTASPNLWYLDTYVESLSKSQQISYQMYQDAQSTCGTMTLQNSGWTGSGTDSDTFPNSLVTSGTGTNTSPLIVTAENLQENYQYSYYDPSTYQITFTLTYSNPFESLQEHITSTYTVDIYRCYHLEVDTFETDQDWPWPIIYVQQQDGQEEDDVVRTWKEFQMSANEKTSHSLCGINKYYLECTDPYNKSLTFEADGSITIENGVNSQCSKLIVDTSTRTLTLRDSNLVKFDSGNYTISIHGSHDQEPTFSYNFQVIIVSEECLTKTITSTGTYTFGNIDPTGSQYDAQNLIYSFKLPEQRYQMNQFEYDAGCHIVWSLEYQNSDGSTTDVQSDFGGISLQIDPLDAQYPWLVVYYAENKQVQGSHGNLDPGPGLVTLKGQFIGIDDKFAFDKFNIQTYLNCYGTLTNLNLQDSHSSPIKNDVTSQNYEYIVNDNALEIPYEKAVWDTASDEELCEFKNTDYQLFIQYTENGLTDNTDIITNLPNQDGTDTKIRISANYNQQVQTYDFDGFLKCDLGLVETFYCDVNFYVEVRSLNETIGTIVYGRLRYRSECYLLGGREPGWTWISQQKQIFDAAYQLRDPVKTFEMYKATPTLASAGVSNRSTLQQCGEFTYKTTFDWPFAQVIEGAVDNSRGAIISIETRDETFPSTTAPYEQGYVITTQLTFLLYPDVVTYIDTVEFTIYDYCFGMSYSTALLGFTETDSMVDYSATEPIQVTKTALSQPTESFMLHLSYYHYKGQYIDGLNTITDSGCGNLAYEFLIPSDLASIIEYDAQEENQLGFKFNAGEQSSEVKTYNVELRLWSDTVQQAPQKTVTIEYKIKACQVTRFEVTPQSWVQQRIDMEIGEERAFQLNPYLKFPLCDYEITYTITALGSSQGQALQEFTIEQEGNQPADTFASIHDSQIILAPGTLSASGSPIDFGQLQGQTFTIYVTGTIEMPIEGDANFEIKKVTSEALVVKVLSTLFQPNTGPEIQDFNNDIEVEPSQTTVVSIGKLFDASGDDVIVLDWAFIDGPDLPWITFLNVTDDNIQFKIEPPYEALGKVLQLEVTLVDNNIEPIQTKFQVTVTVKSSKEQLNTAIFADELIESKSFSFNKVITTSIGEIDWKGQVEIKFSDYVYVPETAYNWSSTNHGAFRISVKHVPSLESRDNLQTETQDVPWSLLDLVDAQGATSTSGSFKQVKQLKTKAIKVQLNFKEPNNVSAYLDDPDSIVVSLKNEMFLDSYVQDFNYEQYVAASTGDKTQVILVSQFSENQVSEIETTSTVSQSVVITSVSTNLILSIFQAYVIQYLWGLINAIQIIMLTSLFDLKIPKIAETTMFKMMELTNLDILHLEQLWFKFFDLPTSEPLNQRFSDAGYGSSDFIVDLGTFFFVFIFILMSYAFKKIGKFLVTRLNSNPITRYLRSENHFKSTMLRYFVEGCIEIGIVAMICIKKGSQNPNWDSSWFVTGQIFLTFFTICLIIMPFYMLYVIFKLGKAIREQDAVEGNRYISLFEHYKNPKNSIIYCGYGILFFVRRYILIVSLVVYPEKGGFMTFLHIGSTLVIIGYVIIVQPYFKNSMNHQELINETFVLLSGYVLLAFSDWVEIESRNTMGLVIVILIGTGCLINIAIVTVISCRKVKQNIKTSSAAHARTKNIMQAHRRSKLNKLIGCADMTVQNKLADVMKLFQQPPSPPSDLEQQQVFYEHDEENKDKSSQLEISDEDENDNQLIIDSPKLNNLQKNQNSSQYGALLPPLLRLDLGYNMSAAQERQGALLKPQEVVDIHTYYQQRDYLRQQKQIQQQPNQQQLKDLEHKLSPFEQSLIQQQHSDKDLEPKTKFVRPFTPIISYTSQGQVIHDGIKQKKIDQLIQKPNQEDSSRRSQKDGDFIIPEPRIKAGSSINSLFSSSKNSAFESSGPIKSEDLNAEVERLNEVLRFNNADEQQPSKLVQFK